MKAHILIGKKREILGRKVKQLRSVGEVPATIYGKKLESVSVTVPMADFKRVYKEAGETGLIELSVDASKHPVLIHTVQLDPVNEATLHVEFHEVDLKVKVKTNVPLAIIGESAAVSEHKGVILSLLNEVEVEALPTELPEKIDVDVTGLTDVGQEVKVSQLSVPSGVTILTDPELGVVKIAELVSKAAEAQAAAEAEAAAAAATEAPAEGAAEAVTAEKTDEKSAEKPTAESKPPQK